MDEETKTTSEIETAVAEETTATPEEPTATPKPTQPIYEFEQKGSNKNPKRLKGWMIWLIIVAGVCLLAVLFAVALPNFGSNSAEVVETPSSDYIGVLYVEGVIASGNVDSWGVPYGYQHQFTLDSIDELINDESNKGLILYVDSPGGGVYESDELYFKIKEYQELTERPVVSYMASMAASGGYYISAPADKIYANRNCWTGSIGVTIGTVYDISTLLDNYGIKTVTITSGRNKAMGSIVDPLTQEQQAIFQSLVNESYEQFVGIVAEGRQMDLATVKTIADGRIYSAEQAYKLGLIDSVSTYDEAIIDFTEAYELEDCEIYDMVYTDTSFLGTLFSELPLPKLPQSDTEAVLSLIKNDVSFPISYMCDALE
ncbi:MAG: signal peptide peptidase SppA [Eubacteriales bacterium]|nr:signal peptide peptidase SppA [Eubacteriales bacterium]MDD3350583.1 signal peptide peptidase SppA [Eubacteriales bacterium]